MNIEGIFMKRKKEDLPTVYLSESNDSAVNLAVEESLLSSIPPGEKLLFLYENNPAVVIGRFQNPWRECRTGMVKRNAVDLRRRISGGGTVVHGPGNLNISIISGISVPEKEENLKFTIRALAGIGVTVEMNGRYDLTLNKKEGEKTGVFKVSGSAFRQTARCSMHHFTLLVNADLGKLGLYLHNPNRVIETRSVASSPSPVANLHDMLPGLTVSDVIDALTTEWSSSVVPVHIGPEDFVNFPGFRDAQKRLVSDEWTWEKTPKFRESITGLKGQGDVSFDIEVCDGRISEVLGPVNTDFLIGCTYQGSDILASFKDEAPEWLNALAEVVDGDGS
ncbi:MAG: hypothetical protein DRZ90_06065 [Spirochaetes bacterium]|nr:MAG: hypothetical protein DRZ90_06065 [Spirochaetota bacterium]